MIETQQELATTQIRRYLPKDFDAVKSLIQGLARLYGDDFSDYFFNSLMQVRVLDASAGTFIADYGGKVCGCLYADTERDPRGVLHGRISNVNIAETCQGKGLGSALVDEAIQFLSALNIGGIWANINPNNQNMIRIFKKREFTPMLKVMEKFVDPFAPIPHNDLKQGEVLYRAVVEKDLPAVKGLIKQLAELFDEDFDPYWFDLTVQKYFQDPAAHIFVAEKAGMIVGITFAEVRRDPVGYSYGYISNIMIQAPVRGQGIGTNLLQLASSFLSNLNVPKIWANVNHDNASMQDLFERQGFKHKFTVMARKMQPEGAC
jgi:ribosomal protein S18 acetylase RimI-like enzyme